MEEEEGEKEGKRGGDKEVIVEGGKGKGVEVEKKEGKGEDEHGSLQSEGGAKIGAEKVCALREKGHCLKVFVGAFGTKDLELFAKSAVEKEDAQGCAKAELKSDLGDDERIEKEGGEEGNAESIERGGAKVAKEGDQEEADSDVGAAN